MSAEILMLHGWGYHAGVWRGIEAATKAKALALDLPGYGSCAEDLFPESLDEVVANILQRAPEKAVWVGWSLGGMVAMRAALLAPERVSALLLVCTTPKFVRSKDWEWGMETSQFEAFVKGLTLEYDENLVRHMMLQAGDRSQARQLRKPIGEILGTAPKPSLETLINGLNLLRTIDLRGQLKQLQMPVHLLAGSNDSVCHPNASSWISAEVDGSLQELPCGHFPLLTHPQEIVQRLVELTSEVVS